MGDPHSLKMFMSLGVFGSIITAAATFNQWWLCILVVLGSTLMDVRAALVKKVVEHKAPAPTPALPTIQIEAGEHHAPMPSAASEELEREACRLGQEHTVSPPPPYDINPAIPAAVVETPALPALYSPQPTKLCIPELKAFGDITDLNIELEPESVTDTPRTLLEPQPEDIPSGLEHSQQVNPLQPQPLRPLIAPTNYVPEMNMDTAAISEMETVQRDLAAALGFRTPSPAPRMFSSLTRNGSTASLASLLDRPRAPFFAPPSPFNGDSVEDIVSMEFLEDSSSPAKTIPTNGTSTPPRTPRLSRASTAPSALMSRTPNFRDELAAFSARAAVIPTIDDVLSVYEASIAPSQLDKNEEAGEGDLDREALTSGDESHHEGDGIFSSDDEDDSVLGSPAATSVDGGDMDPFDSLDSKADAITLSTTKTVAAVAPAAAAGTAVVAAAVVAAVTRKQRPPPSKKRKHGKNNGHKTVPRKHRLSTSGKKKFVSTPFW